LLTCLPSDGTDSSAGENWQSTLCQSYFNPTSILLVGLTGPLILIPSPGLHSAVGENDQGGGQATEKE
jgi:hypothetical protein